MTPYFIPNPALVAALQSAALRGVDVSIVLPAQSDQPWINWASRNYFIALLQRHVRIFFRPPPFAHTKLFLIDDRYLQLGSANLDNRSLRLNFELVLESIDTDLVAQLGEHFASVRAASREVDRAQIEKRSFAARLRDALCWLFSPYL
jgi:cardiolipin synthase